MGKLVILDFNGSLRQGVTVTLDLQDEHDPAWRSIVRTRATLPPAVALIQDYQHWQSVYRSLSLMFRLGDRHNPMPHGSRAELVVVCQQAANQLTTAFNQWLASESFRPVWEQCLVKLSASESIRLILQTEDHQIRCLPWHLWHLLQHYPQAEVVLSAAAYERVEMTGSRRYRPRILAILGDQDGIAVDPDRASLETLQQKAEIEFLVEPERQHLQQRLWQAAGWDILFFAGHSHSIASGTSGEVALNASDRLSLDELNHGLRKAIERGLKLAIFNSCDGLGLARQLEPLHIPHVIVMREPVPDQIAQTFLHHLLSSFAHGQPLHLAVREARQQLQAFEHQYPCATWLPVLCQNPTEPSLTWHSLISPAQPLRPCPYRALAAFQEADAAVFFGREPLAQRLVDAVYHRPLVALVGSSGSGKSSLVFAGLIPRLRQSQDWLILSFRPGNRPLMRLVEAIIPSLEPGLRETEQLVEMNRLAIALQASELTLTDVVDRLLHKSGAQRLLLVADQFEELYSLCEEDDRQGLLQHLLKAIELASNITLVMTLRADFCERVLAYRPLAEALQQYPPVLLSPMSRLELQATIEKPAIAQGITLADGLTDRILDAIDRAPGQLTLLEFALAQLWERQQEGRLTHAAYDAIGGVEQALARYAEEFYAELDAITQQQVQRVFIQLVHPGEGTADTRRLATRTEIGEEYWQVVNRLAETRLVVIDRPHESLTPASLIGLDPTHPPLPTVALEETVEISHEALIQEWGRLGQWLEEDRSFRVWQERLRGACRQWQMNQQDEGGLLRGALLLEAERWLHQRRSDLSPSEQQFIRASVTLQSRERIQRDRQRRHWLMGLSSGITAAVILIGTTLWQWHRAEVVQTNAQLDALSTSSIELSNSGKELEALVQILKAGQQLRTATNVDPDTRTKVIASLHQILYNVREYNRLDGHDRTVIDVVHSPDGQLLASASDDHNVRLWKADGSPIATLKGHTLQVRSVAFSPDGEILASAGYDGTLRLWQPDGTPIRVLPGHIDSINQISFSPDGQLLASASADATVKLWQRDGTELSAQTVLMGHRGWVSCVGFSPDGQTIASGGADGSLRLWQRDGTPLAVLIRDLPSIDSLSFDPSGTLLVSATKDGSVRVWQKQGESFELLRLIQAHDAKIWQVSFSPDGKTFATASADNTIKLWQLDGTLIKTLEGHSSSVFSLSFSPDGTSLASASADQTIRLWHPNPLQPLMLRHNAKITDVGFSRDAQRVVTADEAGLIKIWGMDGSLQRTWQAHKSAATIALSPDGQQLATASEDTTIQLWTLEGKPLQPPLDGRVSLYDLEFSPDGTLLVAACIDDDAVRIWRRNQDGTFATQAFQLLGDQWGWIASVAFSPDGNTVASGSDDDSVMLWHRDRSDRFNSTPTHVLKQHTSRVNQVSFSPNGKTLATASADSYVKLWERDGTLLTTLSGHSSQVNSVIFSPDGQTIASATTDGTVNLWSLNGSLLKSLRGHNGAVSRLSFSPDGQVLASASADQTVILWNFDLADLVTQGCNWVDDYLQMNQLVVESDRALCVPGDRYPTVSSDASN